METNQIHPANHSDVGLPHSLPRGPKSAAPLAWLIAMLLILIGAAFELGMLGFGPYNSTGLWLYSVLGKNMWMAIANLAGTQLYSYLSIWPVLPVSLGFAVLLVARRRNRTDSISASQRRTRHAN